MALPTGYSLRAPTPGDLDAVVAVLVADDADHAEPTLGEDFVRDGWNRSGFDLAADAWVTVHRGGTVVGYAQVSRDVPDVVESWGTVHPAHRARGIGSLLLDRVEERASTLLARSPQGRFRHSVNAEDRDAAAMLRSRGLRPVRQFWHMEIDLVEPFEAGEAPDRIDIDGVRPGDDLKVVHAVLDEAFADDWDYHPGPFDRWLDDQASSPSFDPTLWLLAQDGGLAVGALTATATGDRGWVNEFGVVAAHRGRGIGAALLRGSFATFAGRGLRRALVNVDSENPTGATAVYERAGMHVVRRWDLWERTTGGGGSSVEAGRG